MNYPGQIDCEVKQPSGMTALLTFNFDRVAPITGDGIYRRAEDNGTTRHALLINPHGRDHQLQFHSQRI